MIVASMTVSGLDLREAGGFLKKTAKLSDGREVLITSEDDDVALEIMGTSYAIPAVGSWPGVCRVGKRVVELLTHAPKGEVRIP